MPWRGAGHRCQPPGEPLHGRDQPSHQLRKRVLRPRSPDPAGATPILTFAALSLVRERELGMTELFRAPDGQEDVGQVPVISGARLDRGRRPHATMPLLGVQIQGPVWSLALTVFLVIFASLGLGFAISGLAKTDSQAVQYSMVVLLLSIFFTGFVLPLDQLTVPVRWVSYLVPGTFGISGLQNVIFRGQPAGPEVTGALVIYGLVMVALAWLAVRKDVEPASAPAVRSVSHQLLEVGAKLVPCSADVLADLDLVQLLLELIQTRLYLLPGDGPVLANRLDGLSELGVQRVPGRPQLLGRSDSEMGRTTPGCLPGTRRRGEGIGRCLRPLRMCRPVSYR